MFAGFAVVAFALISMGGVQSPAYAQGVDCGPGNQFHNHGQANPNCPQGHGHHGGGNPGGGNPGGGGGGNHPWQMQGQSQTQQQQMQQMQTQTGLGGAGGAGGAGGSSAANSGTNNGLTFNNSGPGFFGSGTGVSAPGNVAVGGRCTIGDSWSAGIGLGVAAVSGGHATTKPTEQCDFESTYFFLKDLKAQFGGQQIVWNYTIDQQLLYVVSQMKGIGRGPQSSVQSAQISASTVAAPVQVASAAPVSQAGNAKFDTCMGKARSSLDRNYCETIR